MAGEIIEMHTLHDNDDDSGGFVVEPGTQGVRKPVVETIPVCIGLRIDRFERIIYDEAITAQTEKRGVPYETIEQLKGVAQLDKYDDKNAVMLITEGGSMDLRTVPLP